MSLQSIRLTRQSTTASRGFGSTLVVSGKAIRGRSAMTCGNKAENERARRFRDAAIPCLDDAYRFAYFLMRDRTDAEDAVQECYLRALDHFDNWRGSDIKPWLLTTLRNVC